MIANDPCDGWVFAIGHGPFIRQLVPAYPAAPLTLEGFEARGAPPIFQSFLLDVRTDLNHWPSFVDWTLESGPEDAPSCLEIEVPYRLSGGGGDYFMGGCWNPGDPLEVDMGTAWFVEDGRRCEVCLLEPESAKVEQHIAENPPEPEDPDYD